ncbi:MAG: hypothetical protein ACUZ77_10830 [Candidatus Brocadiales bacterium]
MKMYVVTFGLVCALGYGQISGAIEEKHTIEDNHIQPNIFNNLPTLEASGTASSSISDELKRIFDSGLDPHTISKRNF